MRSRSFYPPILADYTSRFPSGNARDEFVRLRVSVRAGAAQHIRMGLMCYGSGRVGRFRSAKAHLSRPSPKVVLKAGRLWVLRDEMSCEHEQIEAEHRGLHVGLKRGEGAPGASV
jgi:hypothetical protein